MANESMTGLALSKDELLSLAARRFEVVGGKDLAGTMGILVDEPVFELFPANLRLSGQDNVRRYYRNFFDAVDGISGEVIGTYVADNAVCLELKMLYRGIGGEVESFRLIAVQPVEGGRFTGERLYGDERLFRLMFPEPIWSLFQPIKD